VRKKTRGFISAELGLVLLVVALLTIGAITMYSNNVRQSAINQNISEIQNIATSAKSAYGVTNLYGSVTTAVAVRSRIVPSNLRDGQAATATNSYGSAITITPANGTGTNDLLTLTWGNVPANQCLEIVNGVSPSMRRITVGGTVVKPLDSVLSVATTTTACETNTSDGVVSITFDIGRS
jgi:Tfp pilus assembly protein PilE